MADLKDTFQKLKSSIIKTNTQKIDDKLDGAVKDILAYKTHSGRNGYIDLVKSLISKSTHDLKLGTTSSGDLFQQGVGPASFGQGGRLMRYKTYQAIVSNINYCYRALVVLVENILSPDDITKISLEVKPIQYIQDEIPTAARVRYIKEVLEDLEIEKKLEPLVYNTLLFGDFFCEIADPQTAVTSRSILTEQEYIEVTETYYEKGIKDRFVVTEGTGDKQKKIEVSIDYSAFVERDNIFTRRRETDIGSEDESSDSNKDKKEKNSTSDKEQVSVKNIELIFHDPSLVLKLQSNLFPICFGYLVFPSQEILPGIAMADQMVNSICLAILKNLQKKIPQMKEFKNDKELKDIIKAMLMQGDTNKALEIRYIPPDKMTHFLVPTTKYYPYGESIFDSTQYSAKVLIALETALAVQRLSRSTEKRKIAIEVGLSRDARTAVENLKEEFRKRKISLDSFGTVDTIPSMITTFEDIYIPQRDGKPFVDVSTFSEGNVDVRSKVDEIKQMRDQLVASLGIPPAFIGIEENLSNKAALSEENILFARTVIRYQKFFTEQINDLIQKVFDIIRPEDSLVLLDTVQISLPIPKSLQYERESRYVSELANLIETLDRIGIPKEYAKRKYLPQFDWEEIKKYDIDEKVEKALDPSKEKEDEFGGMGGSTGPLPGGGF